MAALKLCAACGKRAAPANKLCWRCWCDAENEPRKGAQTHQSRRPLDARTLKDAAALCHPDRHPAEREFVARRTTQALLRALNEARELERAA
jgi:hypothetical protein